MKQRDKMRQLFSRYGDQEEILIREYAAAERDGEVPREKDAYGLTPENYAQRLLADARRKGWILGL